MGRRCPTCGSPVTEDQRFCATCGTALDETTVYFTASELAHDGGEAYGAILAVPK